MSRHWLWLAAKFPVAFLVPFVFADVLDLNRGYDTNTFLPPHAAEGDPAP